MKRLLVPLTGGDADRRALDAAIRIVPDAHIDAKLFRPDPKTVPAMIGDGYAGDVIEMMINAAEERGQEMLANAKAVFQQWQEDTGTKTATFAEIVGSLEDTPIGPVRLADLVVFSRSGTVDINQEMLLSTILFDGGRPVTLFPAADMDADIKHAAIAWDGSKQAARAVAMAMPVLAAMDEISVVTIHEHSKDHVDPNELARTLRANKMTAEAVGVDLGGAPKPTMLRDELVRTGAGIVVMGAYGHSRLREMIFGGVTRDVLENFALPVILAH
ncbi:MAG: universal stress protein [Rhodospirillales bacterium]